MLLVEEKFVEVFLQDYVDNVFESYIMRSDGNFAVGGSDMQKFRLMDKLTCIQCGAVAYQPAAGKSSRSFNVQCEPECEGRIHGVPTKDESKGKPSELPAREPRKS